MRFPGINRFLTGVAIPVSSLRSQASCGIGEFSDLPLMGEWCRQADLDLIQILPVNDTGLDPSPYNAQSAFALNPIYIRLEEVPGSEICLEDIRRARSLFEAAERVQYGRVLTFKMEMLHRIFQHHQAAIANDNNLQEWIRRNRWLEIYWEFLGWTNGLFIGWVQYHLERQLTGAASKLDAMGIALKGDIPILLSSQSADVRANPSLFDTQLRVGAPPDMFSRDGQNWGFPSFRWAEMERDGFLWWRQRLSQASRFYHAYRIDHVLGFFRFWVIPESEESAALGYYQPAHRISTDALWEDAGIGEGEIDELLRSRTLVKTEAGYAPSWHWPDSPGFRNLDELKASRLRTLIEEYWNGQEDLWREHGRKLLEAFAKSTDMLVCAEDLGVVPKCVPEVLEEAGILGLRVERWTDKGGRLFPPEQYPRLTVSTTSTHDSSTLRGWWEEKGWDRQQYYRGLNLPGSCPEYLTTEVCAAILERNLQSNSVIVVLPLQDLFAIHYDLRTLEPGDERINVPGVTSAANWTYRMKPRIESLLAYDRYNDSLRALIARRRHKKVDSCTIVP